MCEALKIDTLQYWLLIRILLLIISLLILEGDETLRHLEKLPGFVV